MFSRKFPLRSAVSRSIQFVLDLIFPVICQNCGNEGEYLCLACQNQVEPPATRCLECGKLSFLGTVHEACPKKNWHLKGLLVAADYRMEAIKSLIWHLKYNNVVEIGKVLSQILMDYVIKSDLLDYFSQAAIIPVPMHPRDERLRGYNQAALIAESLSQKLGTEYLPILQKSIRTKRQVELSRAQRLTNVQGVYQVRYQGTLDGRKIILVDDVATTGATLNECSKVLRSLGAKEIWGLVVARNA